MDVLSWRINQYIHIFIVPGDPAFCILDININVYCATANPIEIIFVETEQGRAILGVVDGFKSKGIESETDIEERKQFLRKIGYKMW